MKMTLPFGGVPVAFRILHSAFRNVEVGDVV